MDFERGYSTPEEFRKTNSCTNNITETGCFGFTNKCDEEQSCCKFDVIESHAKYKPHGGFRPLLGFCLLDIPRGIFLEDTEKVASENFEISGGTPARQNPFVNDGMCEILRFRHT